MGERKSLLKRLQFARNLQKKVLNKFGKNNYTVFLFGSFLTERFVEGKSDIDIAIYTPDFSQYLKISCFLEDLLMETSIPFDIFYIDLDCPDAVFYAPLSSPAMFTEYYPKKLEDFKNICKEKYHDTESKNS